jgi:vancomycin aglycone glucosyltransferase
MGGREMPVLLSVYGSGGDFQPVAGVAVRLRAPGADVNCAAELVARPFDTVAPAAEGCDALVATGVMPAGV